MDTISLTADVAATDKLVLFASALYNASEAEMKNLSLQFPEGTTSISVLALYDVTQMTNVENYSDLEYEQIEVNLGGTYAFTDTLSLAAKAGYQLFGDNEPYVYGDQDGDAYYGNLGVAYRF